MADINARIRLDGEAAYKRQMTDAKNATSALNAELNLAATRFQTTGDKENYMATRSQLLEQKLGTQKAAVEAAKRALQQCAAQGFDANSSKTVYWRRKLAEAETQVEQITREIDNNKKGLDAAGKAYDAAGQKAAAMGSDLDTAGAKAGDLNTSLKNVDQGISWQNVNSAISRMNQAIDAGIRKAVQMGRALWNMTVDSTEWADELATRSATMGIDTQTLQQWDYAARFIDVDVDTIVAARNRLRQNAGSDALTELGVESYDAAGNLRDATDVMWDTMEALSRIENSEEREAKAQELFGRSYMNLLPLIQAGREEWERYADAAPLVSEENLERLTTANDAIENLNATVETTKNNLLAQLAPALTVIADTLSSALTALGEYLETEEGQEKLQAFSDTVTSLAQNLLTIDWGQAVQTAGDALTAITNALQWIIDNKELVLTALAALAGARIWGVLASAASNTGQLVNGVRNLMGHGGGAAATGAAASGTGGTAAATGTGIVGKVAGGLHMGSFAAAGTGTVLGMAALAGIAYAAGAQNEYMEQVYDQNRYTEDPNRAAVERAMYWMANGLGGNGDRAFRAMTLMAEEIGDVQDFIGIFDYTDAERGASNLLVDVMNGTDLEAGNDEYLMASLYRVFEHAFGDINGRGAEAYASLPPEVQRALDAGRVAAAALGELTDDTSLYTYLTRFFDLNNARANSHAGETTAEAEAARIAAEHGASTGNWTGRTYESTWTPTARGSLQEFEAAMEAAAEAGSQSSANTMAALVSNALSGVTVTMDGKIVGRLVAPEVSEVIARQSIAR